LATLYKLIELLEELDIDDTDTLASFIVELGVHQAPKVYQPLLQTEDTCYYTFKVAYQLVGIARNNKTIKLATDKASKIIFALKNFSRQDQTGEKTLININRSLEDTYSTLPFFKYLIMSSLIYILIYI